MSFPNVNLSYANSKMWDQLNVSGGDYLEVFKEKVIEQKVEFAYDILKERNLFSKLLRTSGKSVRFAQILRNMGNESLDMESNEIETLKLYTASVATAPLHPDELALAYANLLLFYFRRIEMVRL